MRLFRLIASQLPAQLAWALLLGLLSGITFAGAIAALDHALTNAAWLQAHGAAATQALLIFIVLVGLLSFMSGHAGSRLVLSQVTSIRRFLVREIVSSRLRQLEAIGNNSLVATLIDEVQRVSQGAWALPVLVLNVGICIAVYAYMGFVNAKLLLIIVCAQALVFALIGWLFTRFMPMANAAALERRKLMRQFQFLVAHTKELKQSRPRLEAFLSDVIEPQMTQVQLGASRVSDLATAMDSLTKVAFLVVIGLLVFAMNAGTGIATEAELRSVIVAFMFVVTPFSSVLNTAQHMSDANQALKAIQAFSLDKEPDGPAEVRETARTVSLHDVGFSYPGTAQSGHFEVKRIDLTLARGEVVVLTGGNGSGKTTLAKLLCGLYMPEQGRLMRDGVPVSAERASAYRQLFTVLWSGNEQVQFWFSEDGPAQQTAKSDWELLGLTGVATRQVGWSEYPALSTGQRGRLALASALSCATPFLVFDEWAANQDKPWRRAFYTDILPRLRAQGHGVLVISHDQEALAAADRVLHLDRSGLRVELEAEGARDAA